MKRKFMKQFLACMVAAITLSTCFVGNVFAVDWDVKPSDVDYYVDFDNTECVFLCNQYGNGTKVGTEYYLTYTVESMEVKTVGANGVLASNQPGARWPYSTRVDGQTYGGLMNHNIMNQLMIEGNTYFFKFTITETGYKYRAAWAQSGESQYLKFSSQAGEVMQDAEHFGVWLGHGGMTGRLSRVRAYDKYGNDLGVRITGARNATVGRETAFKKDTKLNHRYTVVMENAGLVAIKTKRMATGDIVYMEYKVKSSDSKLSQWGGIMGSSITGRYPYLTAYMRHENVAPGTESNNPLLTPGAEYILMFEKKQDRVDLIVQRTLDGVVNSYVAGSHYGNYDESMRHYALWLTCPNGATLNAVLEDFKIYDSNGNNLGVQCDVAGVTVTHYGELENYAGCEALYAGVDDNKLFALYADKTVLVTELDGTTKKGTFAVEDGILTTDIQGEVNKYEYTYQYFKSEDGKMYRRVGTCKVIFDTGKGSEVETQILNEKNGYQAMRPNDPTLKGNKFLGWYTIEGEEFNFEQLIIDSITLYAKWEKTDRVDATPKADLTPILFVAGAVLILAAGGVCGGIILGKGRQHEKKKQQKK